MLDQHENKEEFQGKENILELLCSDKNNDIQILEKYLEENKKLEISKYAAFHECIKT